MSLFDLKLIIISFSKFLCPSEELNGLVKLKGNLRSHYPSTSLIPSKLKFKSFIFLNKQSTKIANVRHRMIDTYPNIYLIHIRLGRSRKNKALANQHLKKNPLFVVIFCTLSFIKQIEAAQSKTGISRA